jgi:hypothetical protein
MEFRNRLLILSCSRRKSREPGLIPALTRYNGPLFQIVRRFARDCPQQADHLDVFVLSAEFGLIRGSTPVPLYDRQMTSERALQLVPRALRTLKRTLDGAPRDLFISVGSDYLPAIIGYERLLRGDVNIYLSTGVLGRRQAELHDWLRGSPKTDESPGGRADQTRSARVRGVEIAMSPNEAIERVRAALGHRPEGAERFQSWYVEIQGHRVAPKWFISCLTGLPVRDFTTDDARRALQQLGIRAQRILYI